MGVSGASGGGKEAQTTNHEGEMKERLEKNEIEEQGKGRELLKRDGGEDSGRGKLSAGDLEHR